MKEMSFAEAYALGLLATNPTAKRPNIVRHLKSPAAKRIATAMSNGNASKDTKSASQDLVRLAKKIRTLP
jgi:hypothetical protein